VTRLSSKRGFNATSAADIAAAAGVAERMLFRCFPIKIALVFDEFQGDLDIPLDGTQRPLISFEATSAEVLSERYARSAADQITTALWARASIGALRTASSSPRATAAPGHHRQEHGRAVSPPTTLPQRPPR